MAERPEDEIKQALNDFLKLYNIEADLDKPAEEEEEGERPYGGYSDVMSKTQAKLDELNAKAEDMLKKSKMTREELDAYGANPDNFTAEQWEVLERIRAGADKLKQQAQEYIGIENLKRKAENEREAQMQKFGKKKRWLPI